MFKNEKEFEQWTTRVVSTAGMAWYKMDTSNVTRRNGWGWPDLVILKGEGEVLFLELKMPHGKLSQRQKSKRDWLVGHGYSWFLCKSKEDVIKAIWPTGDITSVSTRNRRQADSRQWRQIESGQ